jgi:hypothetical protein
MLYDKYDALLNMDKEQNQTNNLENRETSLQGKEKGDMADMGVSMPKMREKGRIRRKQTAKPLRMRELRQQSKHNDIRQENPELETSYRRYDTRASVNDFTKRIWDAYEKPPRVDELLRKQSIRKRENEEIQRREEEIRKRNINLVNLSRTEGWEIIVNLLKQWENFCYMNLRFPETRKDKVSLEMFIGFQNGALWVIEGIRKEIYNAIISLKKENALRNKENGE